MSTGGWLTTEKKLYIGGELSVPVPAASVSSSNKLYSHRLDDHISFHKYKWQKVKITLVESSRRLQRKAKACIKKMGEGGREITDSPVTMSL